MQAIKKARWLGFALLAGCAIGYHDSILEPLGHSGDFQLVRAIPDERCSLASEMGLSEDHVGFSKDSGVGKPLEIFVALSAATPDKRADEAEATRVKLALMDNENTLWEVGLEPRKEAAYTALGIPYFGQEVAVSSAIKNALAMSNRVSIRDEQNELLLLNIDGNSAVSLFDC